MKIREYISQVLFWLLSWLLVVLVLSLNCDQPLFASYQIPLMLIVCSSSDFNFFRIATASSWFCFALVNEQYGSRTSRQAVSRWETWSSRSCLDITIASFCVGSQES